MKRGVLNPNQPLAGMLDQIRSKMEDYDCITICRDAGHNMETCRLRCPGPDQPGTVCVTIERDDPRSSAEIAAEIEKTN